MRLLKEVGILSLFGTFVILLFKGMLYSTSEGLVKEPTAIFFCITLILTAIAITEGCIESIDDTKRYCRFTTTLVTKFTGKLKGIRFKKVVSIQSVWLGLLLLLAPITSTTVARLVSGSFQPLALILSVLVQITVLVLAYVNRPCK